MDLMNKGFPIKNTQKYLKGMKTSAIPWLYSNYTLKYTLNYILNYTINSILFLL